MGRPSGSAARRAGLPVPDDIHGEDGKTVRREIAKWEKFRDDAPWPEDRAAVA